MKKILMKVRTNYMWMFLGIAVLAAILTALGVTTYVSFDMGSIWGLITILIGGLIVGGVIRLIKPGRDTAKDFIDGAFEAGTVILLLYILKPLIIDPVLAILGL